MKEAPKCYGSYGKRDACDSCELAEWCVDSVDMPLLNDNGNIIPIFSHFQSEYDVKVEVSESSRLSKLFAELIYELDTDNADLLWDFLATMSALSKKHPALYRVVRMRILCPGESYSQLGEKLSISKPEVSRNLKLCAELIPSLRKAIGIPSERLSKAKEQPFEIRCKGGNITVLAGAASVVLQMPMDAANSKTVGRIVNGLNNMHWRKRDALLEDLK